MADDGLGSDGGRLGLPRGRLLAQRLIALHLLLIRAHLTIDLQILPLLAARNILVLLRENHLLRILALEASLTARPLVGYLLSCIELLEGLAVPRSL